MGIRVLSVIKPYDKAIQTVGASWVGVYLSNALAHHPGIEKVGVTTEINDYSVFDPKVEVHVMKDLAYHAINKSMLEKAVIFYKEHNYNVMHLHISGLASLKWMKAIIPEDVNVVYTLHNPSMLGRSKIIYGDTYACKLNGDPHYRLVAVSNFNGNVWKEFTGTPHDQVNTTTISNLSTIYNGILEHPVPIRPIAERDKKVCVCSRITPVKNAKQVISFLKEYNVPSIFIGNGYTIDASEGERNYIEECVGLLSSSPNIEWKRDIPNNEVLDIMSKCYMTLHMPVTEAFALVPLESTYVGTPVIYSSLCPPMVEQMGQTNDLNSVGRKVEFISGSRQSTRNKLMIQAINDVFDNPCDPQVVHQYYHNNFRLELMVNKYVDLYNTFNVA